MSIFDVAAIIFPTLLRNRRKRKKLHKRLEELQTLMFYWGEIEEDTRTTLGIAGTPVERGEVELQIREAAANREMYRREYNAIGAKLGLWNEPPWDE